MEKFKPHYPLAEIKAAVPRCLTRAQREQFFLPPRAPRWCYERKLWPYHDVNKTPMPPISWEEWFVERWDRYFGPSWAKYGVRMLRGFTRIFSDIFG